MGIVGRSWSPGRPGRDLKGRSMYVDGERLWNLHHETHHSRIVGGMDKGSIIEVELDCDQETFEFTVNDRKLIFEKRTIGFSDFLVSGRDLKGRSMYVDGERLWNLHHETHHSRIVGGMDKGSIIEVELDCDQETFEFTVNDRKLIFEKRTIGFSDFLVSGRDLKGRSMYVDGERLWNLHHETHHSRIVGGMDKGSIIEVELDCDQETFEFTVNDRKLIFEKRTIGFSDFLVSGRDLKGRSMYVDGERLWNLHHETHHSRIVGGMDKGSIIEVELDCDQETFEFTVNDRKLIFEKRTIGFRWVFFDTYMCARRTRGRMTG
ncbi:hypothetical protein Q1695_001722 [Nippostrongylus brasiliensis]|nr:hypothetical protein Q1695_001722 [Nippostrongylus brasiliensis]